jgi:hypothetical protein
VDFLTIEESREDFALAHLYAYFDQSGSLAEHPVIALCGFVDILQRWSELDDKWRSLLREYEIDCLHAVKALRYSQPYGKMEKGDAQKRILDILPFVRAVRDKLELAVIFAVDIKAYKTAPSIVREAFGDKPDYFAFYETIVRILKHFALPKNYEVALVHDENDEQSLRFYQMLRKMKLEIPEVKKRITSICFCSDVAHPALQAADLIAYVSRKEADRRFFGKDYEFKALFDEFESTSASGKRLNFTGGFFGTENLAALASDANAKRRKKNPRG